MSNRNLKEIPITTLYLSDVPVNSLGLSTLYIDLNSCFATTEQQARPLLRGRPVGITNRLVSNAHIIAASIEAKNRGVKVGMRIGEAKHVCPEIIMAESEPGKYFYVHEKLKKIMDDYSNVIIMKSIDEGLIDLNSAPQSVTSRNVFELTSEIKTRIKAEIGSYMRCNIGLSSNRFLAKLAAELHKPDGMDVILPEDVTAGGIEIPSNIRDVFSKLSLKDLPGINDRMEKRLNTYRIYTPLDFLDTMEEALVKQVFHGIDGTKWYKRLRGVEVDDRIDEIKTVGRQFVLAPGMTEEDARISFMHLVEDVGFRLRSQNLYARGIMVWRNNGGYRSIANEAMKLPNKMNDLSDRATNSDRDIMDRSLNLYDKLEKGGRLIGITLYKLQDQPEQKITLFEGNLEKEARITKAMDAINERFGTRTLHSAETLQTEKIKTKVPFGSTRYIGKNKL